MPKLSHWLVFACTGCFAMIVSGCDQSNEAEVSVVSASLESIDAEVLTLSKKSWPRMVRSQGSLYADEQSIVGAKVAGRIAEVHVDLGDRVNAGDPLVTLDQDEFRLLVEQAEAQLLQARSAVGLREGDTIEQLEPENAPPVRQEKALWSESQSSLERAASLREQNATSQGEYEMAAAAERVAEARYASALNGVREKIALIKVRQAELSLARERLSDAVIRSPLHGFVRVRQIAPGAYVNVGQAVAVIVSTDPLRFRGTVPERYAQSIAVGQEVRMQVESLAQPRTATITRVSPALDQQNRSLTFEALLENKDQSLRAGLFVEASVVVDPQAQALVVPASAITEFAGAEKAWRVVDGVLREQEVRIGVRRDQEFEVLQGLSEGDVILANAEQGRVAKLRVTAAAEIKEPQAVVQDRQPSGV